MISPLCDGSSVVFIGPRRGHFRACLRSIPNPKGLGLCYPGEDDLAIERAVLMYLSMGNLRDANYLMDELKRLADSQELYFPESDLIQFITLLLLTLERDALPLFNMLRVNYKSSIDREPAFSELLDEIAEKFYGVQRRNPLQGMFGDLFKCRCDSQKSRCDSTVHRCDSTVHRCDSTVHRCDSTVHRCDNTVHRCDSTVHQKQNIYGEQCYRKGEQCYRNGEQCYRNDEQCYRNAIFENRNDTVDYRNAKCKIAMMNSAIAMVNNNVLSKNMAATRVCRNLLKSAGALTDPDC
ncbi:putative apyrase 1-like [Hibiscus syriacus]|uniref:Apyrase 1-like n=1 Tax=Hibiscus syriacus TaxID=106335 RepID=A0A6A3ADD8_HIBSY|nr:putative apyrase 1-like [Hibiscus syriacus]